MSHLLDAISIHRVPLFLSCPWLIAALASAKTTFCAVYAVWCTCTASASAKVALLHSQTSFSVLRKQRTRGGKVKRVCYQAGSPSPEHSAHMFDPLWQLWLVRIVFLQSAKYDLRTLKKKKNHLKVTPNWTFQMRNANFWAWKGETLRVRYIHSIPFYEPLSSMLWAQGGTMSRGAINRVRRIRDWAYSVRTGSRFAVLQYRSDLRYLSW